MADNQSEVRCPMCGKPNPAHLEVCQFCQARLKPLHLPQQPEEPFGGITKPIEREGGAVESGLPEWLDFESQPKVDSTPELPSQGASSDWLSGLRDQTTEPDLDAEAMDWESASSYKPSGPVEEVPPWLVDLRSQAIDYPADQTDESSQPEEEPDESSDWLNRITGQPEDEIEEEAASQQNQPESPFEIQVPAESEDFSKWLAQEPATSPETSLEAGEEDQSEPTGRSLLDRLSSETGSSDRLDQADALDEIASHEVPPGEPGAVSPPDVARAADASRPGAEGEEWPSWLADQTASIQQPPPPEEIVEEPAPSEPKVTRPIPDIGELFDDNQDWLAELETAYFDSDVESSAPEAEKSDQWLSTFEPQPEASDQAPTSEELPGWLEELPGSTVRDAGSEAEPEIAPAQLPVWLEAMRPVESVERPSDIPEEGTSQVETAGPLAGLKGILPAEPEMAIGRRPPTYAMKLQVSEAQQDQAALFEQTVRTEAESKPVPSRPLVTSQNLLRYVIAAVLLLVILVPLWPGSSQVALPQLAPEEILATSQIISRLSTGTPVLLAVDYEPGLSGEMDASLTAVVDHLMIQGAFLTLVSTLPTGPMQAEHLITLADETGNHQYSTAQGVPQYVNLGYIPGSPIGLRGFAENPRATLAYTQGGGSAWDLQALAGITSLSQFSLVVVASDSPTVARDWIEQVQPTLGATPMVLVTSAQAAPLIQPYYDASPRQIQGLVSGLAGGGSYGSSIGRSGLAHSYWSSFSFGMVLAVVLIILGGSLNAVSTLLANYRELTSGRKTP
jgi:hypothetical protein